MRKESLRRIVNHALSQSVPASVVTTINGFTKVFAGEIVEKARTVQGEWAVAHEQAALADFEAEEERKEDEKGEEEGGKGRGGGGEEEADMNGNSPVASGTCQRQREFKPPPNPHRGQLLPSHIREALRRYKRDSEGGGVGFSGMSMENLGVRGAFTWNSGSVGGRRLFR